MCFLLELAFFEGYCQILKCANKYIREPAAMNAIEAKYVNKFQCVIGRLPSVAEKIVRGGYQLVQFTRCQIEKELIPILKLLVIY